MSLIRQVPISWDLPSSWTRQGWDSDFFNPERQLAMLDREMRDMNMRSGLRDMNMRSDNRISNMRADDRWSQSQYYDDRSLFRPDDRSLIRHDDRSLIRHDDRSLFRPDERLSLVPVRSGFSGNFDSNAHHSLRLMDQEMRRMTDEMNRMFTHCQHLVPIDSKPETWRLRENFLLDNPIVHDREGNKKFQLQFDVRQFKPEEIIVRTEGKHLSVHARHEEKADNKSVFREYNRQYMIPENIDPERLVSKLSRDGLLTIEAPLPALEQSSTKLIPIEHK